MTIISFINNHYEIWFYTIYQFKTLSQPNLGLFCNKQWFGKLGAIVCHSNKISSMIKC